MIDTASNLINELADRTEYLPYLKTLNTIRKHAQKKRIERFLISLNVAENDLNEKQKAKLNKILNSEIGKDLLTDYIDAILRSSSHTVITAFALLYSDVDSKHYSEQFKNISCISLQRLSEDLVDIFIIISSICDKIEPHDDKFYPLYHIDTVRKELPKFVESCGSPESEVMVLNEFKRRGLLLTNYANLAGENLFFGIGENSKKFRKLLMKAKKLNVDK